MKPLPDAPEDVANPVDLVATGPPLPPVATKVHSELDDPGVKDLGWRNDSIRAPSLIRGMSNDEIFMLIRRFNKQVQHVRALPTAPPRDFLDFEIADDEEFSPDKLRANLERLYMTMIVGMAAFGKHIARLRSWNEPRRTAKFGAIYFIAWYLHLIPAVMVTTILVLMFHPPSRIALFPPAPLAAISASSGNLQVPRSGTLGSADSLTGAPEAHQGEAVEQEASHFVASFAAIGAGTVMGQGGAPKRKHGEARADVKHDADREMETEMDQATNSDDSIAGGLPDPSEFALHAKNVKDTANSNGVEDPAAHVAKKSVEGAMWEKSRPMMRILADIADTWERFGNALDPVVPFPKWTARLRLAGVLLPLLLANFILSAKMLVDGTMFLVGVVFFSQPVLSRLTVKFTHRFPHWQKYLELRRSLLKGVPTNAQLTITLLRIAELAKAPLPPPPIARAHQTAAAVDASHPAAEHPPHAADNLKQHDFAFDTENYEVDGVDEDHPGVYTDGEGSEDGTYVDGEGTDNESVQTDSEEGAPPKKKKRGHKLVSLIRKTTHTGVSSILGVDHIKAKIGSERSKRRLGAVAPPPSTGASGAGVDNNASAPIAGKSAAERALAHEPVDEKELAQERANDALAREGPTSFSARVHGTKGRLLLVTSAASPCLAFVPEKPLRAALSSPSKIPGVGGTEADGIDADFTVGLSDVVSLRKMGGFGWKGRLLVGWATGRDVVDGLEVVDKFGTRRVVTAIRGRDELFNRLISLGTQSWECL
ncbi:hypothetical protein C8Q80DRAFT_1092010 [Daedaleopsis nitida]|nr:hypothetical protein C8Q80DRAFT_1092010 [Daedaleopsis nitida]